MAKVSPWTGSNDLPPLEMKPLRALVLKIWRMELVRKGLLSPDSEPIHNPLAEPDDLEIPLDGLVIKLVDLSLQIKLISEYVEQVCHPDDDPDDPLYLVRHSQLLGKPLDRKSDIS